MSQESKNPLDRIDIQRAKKTESTNIRDVGGIIKTVNTAPSGYPRRYFDSVVVYDDGGGTRRLYVYDSVDSMWRYTSLT